MRSLHRSPLGRLVLLVSVVVIACGQPGQPTATSVAPPTGLGGGLTPAASISATAGPTAALNPLASPSVSGTFAVDDTGRKLAMMCWGNGSPAVFLEAGGGGLDEFQNSRLVRYLAAETKVCLYNRAGRPPSDAAPDHPREAEDVADDFHALVRAAGVEPPLVLFGRSFGGMLVTFYASRYPDDVAGVVVFDSPAPSATMTVDDFPEGVWNYPGNVEHLNVLTGYENRFGKTPVHIDAPLILISTTAGESQPDDRYWLQTSDDAEQVVLEGGMEVIDAEAAAIAEQILKLVRG